MWMNSLILGVFGVCFGCLVAGGVFTVLFVVGLVPRFACKTGTARYEIFYEECIIWGVTLGAILSIYEFPLKIGTYISLLPHMLYQMVTNVSMIVIGGFSGIFVGCLALATAEMLDAVPIFARRVRLKGGFNYFVFAIALGKMCGSLCYFLMGFHLQM